MSWRWQVGSLGPTTPMMDGSHACAPDTSETFTRFFTPLIVVMMLSAGLGRLASASTDGAMAREAAETLFRRLDRASLLDPLSSEGQLLAHVAGEVELRDVVFAYPSAQSQLVCRGICLHVGAGECVALCGPSGGGKSTVVSLVERFYDPLSGAVCLDGVDLRVLNVRWLREQLGLVSQEPVLFSGSVGMRSSAVGV